VTSIRLTRVERQERLDHFRRAADAEVRLRAHILLFLADGHPWATIRVVLFCSLGTISRWKARFSPGCPSGLGANGVEHPPDWMQ
jgi:putative transposase